MAAIETEINIKEGSKIGLRQSSLLEILFKAVGIGANNIQIREKTGDPDVLEIASRVKVLDGIGTDEIATKGQVDTSQGTLQDQIDTIQDDINSISENNPDESLQIGDGVTTVFTIPFAVENDNTVRDLEVFVDGRREGVALDGVFNQPYKNWRKNSATEIEFATAPTDQNVIIFWKQGTSVVSGGSDLQNIVVDLTPAVNGNKSIGTVTKAFKSVFIKDKNTAQVYELEVVDGVFQATEVP